MDRTPLRRGASVPVPDRSILEPDSPAANRLDGARAIAQFWFGADTAETRKRIFKLAQDGTIPVAKLGGQLLANPSKDHQEAVWAFAQKRWPNFTGR
jgi:hypothetical protein